MLRTLRVRDLALIEELELVLEPGLNVITGETGAGKSILLQALDVALGGRPDADLVRTGAEEAAVEALFANVPVPARERLAGAGIPAEDGGDELLVRRVIARGGRTRAYVNGALGSLALLRELAPHLLRVYGQDEHQALRRVESHRELLDAVGGLGRTLEEMRARHGRLVAARQAIAAAHADTEAARERAEMLRAQAEELVRAALVPGEEEALRAERARLVHAARLAVPAPSGRGGARSSGGGRRAICLALSSRSSRRWRSPARASRRVSPSPRGARSAPRAGTRSSSSSRPTRARSRARSPAWPRAASCRASCSRSRPSPPPTRGAPRSSSTRSMPASAARSPKSSAASSATSAAAAKSSVSPTCR